MMTYRHIVFAVFKGGLVKTKQCKSWPMSLLVIGIVLVVIFVWIFKESAGEKVITASIALISMLAVATAYFLGERKAAYWESDFADMEAAAEQKRAAWRRIVTVSHETMKMLEGAYYNTPSSRMQLRKAYHSDTFSVLIDALSAVPVHELEQVEAIVALMGLKKNMIEAQQVLDAMLAAPLQWHLESIPDDQVASVSLIFCKAQAETHYDNFMRAFRGW